MITLEALVSEAATKRTRRLTPDQVEARLLEAHATIHAAPPETFEAGTIVWFKLPHLSPYRDAENPMVFAGYLDRPIAGTDLVTKPNQVGYALAAAMRDCRIGCLCGNDTYHQHLADSRELTATRPPIRDTAEEAAETPTAEDLAPPADAASTEEPAADPAPSRASPWREPAPAEASADA